MAPCRRPLDCEMHISDRGLALIEQFEGFSSRPYWDPYGRVWTRGYGETEGISQRSRSISRQQGQVNLRRLIEQRYEWAIHRLGVDLFNQNQWDALCSFVWNLGAGIFTGRLRVELQARRWPQAAQLMLAYDHAGGQVLAGLARRRRLEVDLFLRPPAAYVPVDEQRWIREYDQLPRSGAWAAMRRRVLRRVMTRRRKLIWHLAQGADGWRTLNRAARYRQLLVRTE
jgi:GH24 family phage-related lysozyme (muramidase)